MHHKHKDTYPLLNLYQMYSKIILLSLGKLNTVKQNKKPKRHDKYTQFKERFVKNTHTHTHLKIFSIRLKLLNP